MIPPEYWRRLKKELARLNLDEVSETALPMRHPEGRRTAIQFEEAIDAIIEERCKRRISAHKSRIGLLQTIVKEQQEKIGELESLLSERPKKWSED